MVQEDDLWVLTMGCRDLDGGHTGTGNIRLHSEASPALRGLGAAADLLTVLDGWPASLLTGLPHARVPGGGTSTVAVLWGRGPRSHPSSREDVDQTCLVGAPPAPVAKALVSLAFCRGP